MKIIRGKIVSPGEEIIQNGAIVVDEQTIIDRGDYHDMIRFYGSDTIIGDENSIVIPGFVNTHSHAVQTFFRGAGDDLSLLDWLNRVILPGEASLSADEVYSSCRIGYAEMLLSGITTTNDMLTGNHSFRGLQAAEDSGIRGHVGKMLMDREVPEEMLASTDEVMDEAIELSDRYPKGGRIQYSFSPRFIITCSDELMRSASNEARERGLLFHTHAAENISEGEVVRKLTGKGYIHALNDLGCLHDNSILAHCVWTSDEERDLIASTETSISHNPSSNAKLASGIAPVPDYIERDIPVGLATDGSPASGGHDFFLEMRLASFLQSVSTNNPRILSARKIFDMATVGGAEALKLTDVGCLKKGFKADITVINPSYPSAHPMYDPYSYIVYTASTRDIDTVIVNGIEQVIDGQLVDDISNDFEISRRFSNNFSP